MSWDSIEKDQKKAALKRKKKNFYKPKETFTRPEDKGVLKSHFDSSKEFDKSEPAKELSMFEKLKKKLKR